MLCTQMGPITFYVNVLFNTSLQSARHRDDWITRPEFLHCTYSSIQPGRIESASPLELITPWIDASCVISVEAFAKPFLHLAQRKTGFSELPGAWLHTFSADLRHERGDVGEISSLISSPPWRLAVWPKQPQHPLSNCTSIKVRQSFHP